MYIYMLLPMLCVHAALLILGCVERIAASHNTHPRATRSQHYSTAARSHAAPIYYKTVVLCCTCACACAGRHSLAAPRCFQPEITALARRGRKNFDSPLAMMHTRRSSAHVSLTAFWCESCAHNMRPAASRGEGGCAPRRTLAVGTLPRPLRGLPGPRHSCQHLLSCLDVRKTCVAAP